MENLGPGINFSGVDDAPCISADGLTLYFTSRYRPGGNGHWDILKTTRATKDDPWGQAVILPPPVNWTSTGGNAAHPWISPDGLEIYFNSMRPPGYGEWDIWVAKRATEDYTWGDPVNLGPGVSSPYYDVFPSLSPDGLLLLFCDSPWGDAPRPGGYGNGDLGMARRASLSVPWQGAVNLGPMVNSPACEAVPRISPDGHTLYFYRGSRTWQVPIIPIVDFNGDGEVDGKDVSAMAQHWGENYPPCDIAPFAWGDGVVDANDLTVLAGYIGQDVNDPTLIAHWSLDEAEGAVVHNSIGATEAMATGDPTWQPAGGKVAGALAFDGMDDFVLTQFKLNPANRPFSVLAWVKGGAPGEAVLSQQGWADWLYTNPIDGSLMTGLMGTGATAAPAFSDVVITDGQWHRIGLVWDGTNRILLVDGKETARDAQSKLADCTGTLILGAGKSASPATFWSGLIDDVRVYNRAVAP